MINFLSKNDLICHLNSVAPCELTSFLYGMSQLMGLLHSVLAAECMNLAAFLEKSGIKRKEGHNIKVSLLSTFLTINSYI